MLNEEVIVEFTDDFDCQEIFYDVKDIILEDDDKVVDQSNENHDQELA